ncbi:vitamin B12 ABC transporter ATP-binding protein BtuD [Izhakiella australiensis]|uniref:Vitamin B12 import ATP-binding protein BtuD n=1 Tax=Izhakiella australiensis TaxID=1926881 RepID=A0A1S8YQ23_9GAMM|nr:vitamin B12 ABC transporter ATP-binding protein BtuD [Izhakiella australiensis]OON41251.1 vitamin B12 ABC transporter ATP-binding protein BtuD [Izhakiella australiensis]
MLTLRALALHGRLKSFSADVAPGELVHLIGPNGAGKSTLLALLSGLQRGEGEVALDGQRLFSYSGRELARVRSYLSQHAPRPPAMPVWHYLMLHNVSPAPQREAALMRLVETLQLSDKLRRPLQQLSGGEWQRVRLAAVFFQLAQPEGRLLLLDEPLTGLDVAQQAAFDALLPPLLAAGVSIVMSSHDVNHTLHHAHRVWMLRAGEVVAQGDTDTVMTADSLQSLFGIVFHQARLAHQRWLLGEALPSTAENSYR